MRAALLMGLAACTSAAPPRTWCPQGEKCSPLAPEGLSFDGPVVHRDVRTPTKLALGGTAAFTLEVQHTSEDGVRTYTPLDSPYTATVNTTMLALEQSSNVVTLRALANAGDRLPAGVDATLDIRDSDGLLLGRTDVVTAPIATIAPTPLISSACSLDPGAIFAPGGPVVIALSSTPDDALYDESLRVTGAQQLAWDVIAAPAVTGAVTVAAGDHAPVDLVIPVATDAAIAACMVPAYVDHGGVDLCFEARSGGHVVDGAAWQFTVDGVPVAATSALQPSCLFAPAQPMATSMTVVASAVGASLTVTLPVI